MKIRYVTDLALSPAEKSGNKIPSGLSDGRLKDRKDTLNLSFEAKRLQAESFSERDRAILEQEATSARFNTIRTRIGRGYYDESQITTRIAEKLMEQTIVFENISEIKTNKPGDWSA